MSDVEYDLAEILRSPLDPDPDEEAPRPWGWATLFLVVGVVIGVWIAAGSGADAAAEVAAGTTTPGATQAPEVVEIADAFPDGYVAITTDVAVRAETPLLVDDRMLVPMTLMLRRGAEATAVERPLGGRWELRTDQGVLPSVGTVYDPFRPSVFSVEFPAVDPLPGSVILVERWDASAATAAVELPWPGVPFIGEGPIGLELSDGAALVIADLELGNFLGRAAWRLEGTELGIVELEADLLDDAGDLFDSYASGRSSLDADAGSGAIDFFWAPGFRVDQDEASTLRLTARVSLGSPVATEVEVPLP